MPPQRVPPGEGEFGARTVKAYEMEQGGWDKDISHRRSA